MKRNRLILVLMIAAFATVYFFMQYYLSIYGRDIFVMPNKSIIAALFDVALGVLLCVISRMISKKKEVFRKILSVIGIWNMAGGVLFFIISVSRLFVQSN